MDYNTLCTNGKGNKYSTLRFTYLVVPRRLWRHIARYNELRHLVQCFGSVC